MHSLYVALILVTLASLAIVAVNYTAKSRRQPALAGRSGQRLAHSDEGSVVLPVRDAKPLTAGQSAKKLALALATAHKQEQAIALEEKVDDTIRRLILMN